MVTQAKIKIVEDLSKEIKSFKTIMICDFAGLPSSNFQNIRKTIKGIGKVYVTKNTLIKRVIEKSGIKNSTLTNYLTGNTAIVLSNESVFKIYKNLASQKTYSPPKPNSIATDDIVVKSGDTPFSPGPMVATMQKYGIKAAIKKGKVEITEDSVVVKKGERVPAELSQILGKLGITPIELWLKVKAGYENGIVFTPEILNINVNEYKNKILSAHQSALNLAIARKICNKYTVNSLVIGAFLNAKNLAVERNIPVKETINELIVKAYNFASAVKSCVKNQA